MIRIPWLGPLAGASFLAAGCAHPAPSAAPAAAVEQARREERVKIMNEYWFEHTLAPGAETTPGSAPLLSYPPGLYSGIRYGARTAPDPSLREPAR
jgi:hypothetical protein